MIQVPDIFKPKIKVAYPPGNDQIFEQWLIENFDHPDYLPINWCAYQVNNNYGKNTKAMVALQRFINSLPANRHYFTVTQYDDGPLAELGRLEMTVFGSGGGRVDFPLPLICKPHGRHDNNRDIFSSFIGSITHPIRKQMCASTASYIKTDHIDINSYCEIMARSVFTLAPRGYGLSSFRICEALEQGSIPCYISDQFIIPGNIDFENYGVLIHSSRIEEIDHILESISPEEIARKQEYGRMIYEKIYTFEGCRQLIIDNI